MKTQRKLTKTNRPTGRPSSYSEQLAGEICLRLAEGESLRSVCEAAAMPSRATVMRWLRDNDDFHRAYAEAKRQMLEQEADKMLEIADDETIDPHSRRVRLDTRKWILSKLLPKKYGDYIEPEATAQRIRVVIGGNAT